MIELRVLADARAAAPLQRMTYPAYRGLLELAAEGPAALPIAIGAFDGGAPVGLTLASVDPAAAEAKLLSLFVDGPARRRGIGTALARRVEVECAARGIGRISATYMSGLPATPVVERIFARTGWSAPRLRMLVVRCTAQALMGMPWFGRLSLPPGGEIVPWVEVSPAERDALRTPEARTWVPKDLDPFDHEQDLEPVTSLALRVRGEVLGWCVNHVVEGVLRCTCSYLHKDMQRRALGMALWSEMVSRMSRIGLETLMWTVPSWRHDMVRFTRTHVRPHAQFFGETLGVERAIEARAALHVP